MCLTRKLSAYKTTPSDLSLPPPEGPNSGVLVVQDEDDSETACCFGFCNSNCVKALPFPQDKKLRVVYTESDGENVRVHVYPVMFIPVLNQPLASNRYYAIKPNGRRKGQAFTCSKEEDKTNCCFFRCVSDLKPRPLDPQNVYQQFEIKKLGPYRGFTAKSLALDGYPPYFLRKKGWRLCASTPRSFELQDDAFGLDERLRSNLPDFELPLSSKNSSPVVVGKWYCPFMFVEESGLNIKDQMEQSMYYSMTLEQRWEQIFSCCNTENDGNKVVTVDIEVPRKEVSLFGSRGSCEREDDDGKDGVMWFRSRDDRGDKGVEEAKVGLSLAIVERLKAIQGLGAGEGGKARVEIEEEYGGKGRWERFGCYLLVESFVLRRFDGTLVLTYDFKHAHLIKSKWE